MSVRLGERWLAAAYRGDAWLALLRPLEALYRWAVERRRRAYQRGDKPVWRAPVPVIVVGNITLGGTGKSPLTAWIADWLAAQGWRPGIVSRGYGGRSEGYPLRVDANTPPSACGDEPLMLALQCGVPVVVDPDRPRGARALLDAGCDIVISDDGLQHLALGRDIELVVVDARRGLGNARCLPAGPLREPVERLARVDAVLLNGEHDSPTTPSGYRMQLAPQRWHHLASGARYALRPLPFETAVHGVAGIGHPQRFFATLAALGLEVERHAFADHHHYQADELAFDDARPVVMTAKDAVKCRAMADPRHWALEVEAQPDTAFVTWLEARLAGATNHCKDTKGSIS
ncbi:tetraacyldisaccharide 4'-kinase [Franzmannia qiaohouensis]|uniref:Tetraacyldisaccharide 4'-kinase n=1 Tax=Franzmannia qiaohouensis TaxID=1329370 RepID=A0ABU1HD92_9GAMM|nr:tetraacyldisaccharide 4'-kinase [Halomonas qiaohouensis]MDR5905446.1 tetraacyldisaccharide 4'-kinase [Halomonas qiaohouensis]